MVPERNQQWANIRFKILANEKKNKNNLQDEFIVNNKRLNAFKSPIKYLFLIYSSTWDAFRWWFSLLLRFYDFFFFLRLAECAILVRITSYG